MAAKGHGWAEGVDLLPDVLPGRAPAERKHSVGND
jgi:hypothetical protein